MNQAATERQLPRRRLACARCGAEFDCGSGGIEGACWCMDEAHRMAMPSAAADDCLCPACLRAAALSGSIGRSA
ncbi:MAG TPA: cysteine-rich CWC family protein [Alphaproteobacteria bacterium]